MPHKKYWKFRSCVPAEGVQLIAKSSAPGHAAFAHVASDRCVEGENVRPLRDVWCVAALLAWRAACSSAIAIHAIPIKRLTQMTAKRVHQKGRGIDELPTYLITKY
mgnify:CR=1 FL=1